MSIAQQDQRGFPEPPVEDWGDGPAAYEPGQRPSRPGDRTPPQDNAAQLVPSCGPGSVALSDRW